jgi:hypothetical protein
MHATLYACHALCIPRFCGPRPALSLPARLRAADSMAACAGSQHRHRLRAGGAHRLRSRRRVRSCPSPASSRGTSCSALLSAESSTSDAQPPSGHAGDCDCYRIHLHDHTGPKVQDTRVTQRWCGTRMCTWLAAVMQASLLCRTPHMQHTCVWSTAHGISDVPSSAGSSCSWLSSAPRLSRRVRAPRPEGSARSWLRLRPSTLRA